MSEYAFPRPVPRPVPRGSTPAIADVGTLVARAFRLSLRNVDGLITALALPVLLMLMFVYLFGGAIESGGRYVDYVVPGVLLVCVGFGAATTAVSVAHDLTGGIIDRFRAMDVRGEALINSHVVASVARNLLSSLLVFAVAFAIGFRSGAGVAGWVGGGRRAHGFRAGTVLVRRQRRHPGALARGGERHDVSGQLPAVRKQRVRPDPHDARLASGFRPQPARDGGRRCAARVPFRSTRREQRLARARLERRHHRRFRRRVRGALPEARALTNDGPMPAREFEDLPFAPFLEPWDGTLAPDVRYDTVHMDGAEVTGATATGARFVESALTSMTFDEGTFRLSRWSDAWLKAVRWIGTDLSGTDWMDVEINASMFAGAIVYDAQLRRVTFHESRADSVNLRGARLQEVTFVDCQLNHVDFAGATLDRRLVSRKQPARRRLRERPLEERRLPPCPRAAGDERVRRAQRCDDHHQPAGDARAEPGPGAGHRRRRRLAAPATRARSC